jgi:hypothetical protein
VAEFFSYDPLTGVKKMWDYDQQTDEAKFRDEQDVSPLLAHTREARNTRFYDGNREMRLYCQIPPVVQQEFMRKGIDIYSKDPTMIRRMFQEINSNYPWLKTTDKVHV